MTLTDKRVLVIGAGRTGRAVVRLALERGAWVRVLDRVAVERHAGWPSSRVEIGVHEDSTRALEGVDLVIPSPGVARTNPLLSAAVAARIPVWSELELASRQLSCPMVAITGTNGKSTTTVLTGNILSAAGRRVFVGGNLGAPLAEAVSGERSYDVAVVEVSSFQLEWVETFRPRVGVWLNLTADHMDRYADLEDYGAAKAALFARQTAADVAVLNRQDERVWSHRDELAARIISFGTEAVDEGAFLDGDTAVVRFGGGETRCSLSGALLTGAHNRENILAAASVAVALDIPVEALAAGLRATAALPHRLELVAERRGARFFDDSKATNIGAVRKSIDSFDERIVLLLGGYDKGGDFASLRSVLRERVERVVCFGAAGPHIAGQLDGATRCEVVATMADAVRAAAAAVKPGQSVVLAPGCASFDEFESYAERGTRFRALVEEL
jgi:UDP-N-acetylmuramoylalanine--D-glutamate ligase